MINSMTIEQLQQISSLICSIIIGLTLITSIKISSHYRKKNVFISFIVGLACALIPNILTFIQGFQQAPPTNVYSIISTLAYLISFIIVNFVMIKMFASHAQVRKLSIIVIACGVIVAFVTSLYIDSAGQTEMIRYPIMDIYMLILIMTMIVVTRQVPMPTAYFVSLIMMFAYQVCIMLYGYVFQTKEIWLYTIISILTVIYYGLIYYIQLHWILNRLVLTYQSSIMDGLTGLYVRKFFERRVLQFIHKKPIAILFCDIDNFKMLNDQKGHQVADIALQQVATIVKEEVAPYGVAGRYGGEEIVAGIVIDKVKPNQIAERIRTRIEQEANVTVSIGVSTSKDADELHILIKQADEAMYYSKNNGKNRTTLFRSLPASIKNKITV